jgi:hypothetical protein
MESRDLLNQVRWNWIPHNYAVSLHRLGHISLELSCHCVIPRAVSELPMKAIKPESQLPSAALRPYSSSLS